MATLSHVTAHFHNRMCFLAFYYLRCHYSYIFSLRTNVRLSFKKNTKNKTNNQTKHKTKVELWFTAQVQSAISMQA